MLVVPGSAFPITFADSVALSAFGRLQTSQPKCIFSSQQQYGDETIEWETSNSGTGTATFLANESTIQMSTGGTANAASCIRQTRFYHRYTPGFGQTIFQSFVMDGGATVTNNRRRIGYFDANNGIFLELLGNQVSLNRRTSVSGSPVDAQVLQANWNIDKFDGNGPSGKTLDWTKAQIMVIDLQWLGVGRVRIGFDIDGVLYPAHQFLNANTTLTSVYMTSANLPLRIENTNTGTASGTATLRHICSSVMSDGGAERTSFHQFAYNTGGAGKAVLNGSRIPIISLRAKTTGPNGVRNTGQIEVAESLSACVGTNPIFWELVLNGTLTNAAFAAYNANLSITDVDNAATAITGGRILDAGYLASSASAKASERSVNDIKDLILAYSGLLNQQDIMTLVASAPAGNTTVFCNFTWLEIWG